MSKENIAEIKKLTSQIIDGFDELGIILAGENIGSDINLAANIVEQFYKDLFGKDYHN